MYHKTRADEYILQSSSGVDLIRKLRICSTIRLFLCVACSRLAGYAFRSREVLAIYIVVPHPSHATRRVTRMSHHVPHRHTSFSLASRSFALASCHNRTPASPLTALRISIAISIRTGRTHWRESPHQRAADRSRETRRPRPR